MFKKIAYILVSAWLVFSLFFVIKEFWAASLWLGKHLSFYKWFFIGAGAYLVIRLLPFVRKNEEWMQVFSHELSHTVVGLLFFRRIHSFQAGDGEGEVQHSGMDVGRTFISLAPYCIPVFTFAFLLLRIIGAWKSLYIFDLLIGFTLAFHLLCFLKQTRLYQTDIRGVGYIKAFLFIACTLLFNLTIVILSIRMGIVKATVSLFTNYWHDIIALTKTIF